MRAESIALRDQVEVGQKAIPALMLNKEGIPQKGERLYCAELLNCISENSRLSLRNLPIVRISYIKDC